MGMAERGEGIWGLGLLRKEGVAELGGSAGVGNGIEVGVGFVEGRGRGGFDVEG